MNELIKSIALCAALLLAGLVQTRAASTNLVQHITFQLTFLEQGPTNHPSTNLTVITATKSKMRTRDVIAALGAATTNAFSSAATLVRVQEVNAANNVTRIEIRDGTNVVDVTVFFAGTFTDNVIRTSTFHENTGVLTGVRFGLLHFAMTNSPPFDVKASLRLEGLSSTTHTSIVTKTEVIGVDEVESSVIGTSTDTNGVTALVSGSVSILGRSTEIK